MHSFLCPLLSIHLTSFLSPRALLSLKYTSSVPCAITQDTLSHHAHLPSLFLSVWQESEIHSLCPSDCLQSGMAGMYPKEKERSGGEEKRGGGGFLVAVKKGTAWQGGRIKGKANSSNFGRPGSVTV